LLFAPPAEAKADEKRPDEDLREENPLVAAAADAQRWLPLPHQLRL